MARSIGVPAISKLRFNALCTAMTNLALDARVSEEACIIVSAGIRNLQGMIATPHPDGMHDQQGNLPTQQDPSSSAKEPTNQEKDRETSGKNSQDEANRRTNN
uniref:Uncharacterized protein n=1 Tax=Oryza punctata TaxID=4537 RepID=A0A0E0KZ05_ORYPU